MMLTVLAVLALLLMAGGLWLLASARLRAGEEALAERVGQLGAGEFVDELAGLHHLRRIRNPVTRYICHQFWGAGIDMAPGTANTLLIVVATAFLVLMLVSPLIGAAFLVAVILGGYLLLKQRIAARRRRIAEQLPDYLEYVLRSLTAGNTLEEALQSAAMESTEPARSLFLSVARQVRLGATVEGTLAEAGDVHKLRALHILAMAARVNRRFGGSMRRVIKSLIGAIRRQDAATRELKALTGETRFSAWVVAAIPIGISALFYAVNPGYYDDMLASGGGRFAIGLAVALQLVGMIIIWRMVASLRDAAL